jgi:hypothetical protein
MTMRALLILISIPVWIAFSLVLYSAIHAALNFCCFLHARRYCRANRLEINRWRLGPVFGPSGVKTEYTIVQFDCEDSGKNRRLLQLLVWPFGLREVLSNEQWKPQNVSADEGNDSWKSN